MADPVEVQRWAIVSHECAPGRHFVGTVGADDGDYYMHADISPLLAELAELRERTRMRPKTDTSHGDNQVIVKHVPYASDEVVVSLGRMREFGWSYVQGWWPLPGETNG